METIEQAKARQAAELAKLEREHAIANAAPVMPDAVIIPCSADATRKFTANLFADRLRVTNPNFDRRRFLLACGVDA